MNASASKFALSVLEAAMEAGVNVVDLSGGVYPWKVRYLEKSKQRASLRSQGAVDPGLIDIVFGYGMDLMDEMEGVHFAFGGLLRYSEPPLDYKIVFGEPRLQYRGVMMGLKASQFRSFSASASLSPFFLTFSYAFLSM